jgi:hypothetical protein
MVRLTGGSAGGGENSPRWRWPDAGVSSKSRTSTVAAMTVSLLARLAVGRWHCCCRRRSGSVAVTVDAMAVEGKVFDVSFRALELRLHQFGFFKL